MYKLLIVNINTWDTTSVNFSSFKILWCLVFIMIFSLRCISHLISYLLFLLSYLLSISISYLNLIATCTCLYLEPYQLWHFVSQIHWDYVRMDLFVCLGDYFHDSFHFNYWQWFHRHTVSCELAESGWKGCISLFRDICASFCDFQELNKLMLSLRVLKSGQANARVWCS